MLFEIFIFGLGVFVGYNIGLRPGSNFVERAKNYFTFQR